MSKQRIIEALGEEELLLPELVRRALAANDRVKYLLTLVQTARAGADGDDAAPNLREERLASGVGEPALDGVVRAAARRADGVYTIPEVEDLVRRAHSEVEVMLAAVRADDGAVSGLDRRLAELSGELAPAGDAISGDDISRLTSGRRGAADSLHLIVMDAHRELNRVQQSLATESIDGALVRDLSNEDRALVRAFMRGLARTQALRFDHPGLGTVATRSGPALVLQNDIGETDAHVLVVHVTEGAVTITYTDVHLERLRFFQRLFEGRDVQWEGPRSRSDPAMEDGRYHLTVGRFEAATAASLQKYLEHVGSRLVFLIDWNRARKRLRRLVGKGAAIDMLRWAAEHDYGHMAFLLAGSDALVYDALEFGAGRAAHAGDSLSDVLGVDAAREYLRSVLRICAQDMLAGRPLSLIQDKVRAELIGHVRTARQELMDLIRRHAELVVEIGETVPDALEEASLAHEIVRRDASAQLAREWERRADEVVNRVRAAASRTEDPTSVLELVETADDVGDSLEEATYYLALLPQGQPAGGVRAQTRRLTTLVLAAARAYLRATVLGREVGRAGPREDMDGFLEAVHRVVGLERETDEVQRSVHAALVAEVDAPGILFVLVEATRALEEAADALMHAARKLRTHVLGRVVASEPPPRRPGRSDPVRLGSTDERNSGQSAYVIAGRETALPDAAEIGGKAHGLARMARAGLRVPEAAVLGTSISRRHSETGGSANLEALLAGAVDPIEQRTGLGFGDVRRPLLLSVRSGAPVSMPGMLETVLDIGVCDATVDGLVAMTGNPRLAWDCYRRLVESYAHVVAGCPAQPFEEATRERLSAAGVQRARDLDALALADLTHAHLERFAALADQPFPQEPQRQLEGAVRAVLDSWGGRKAREYRRLKDVPESLGTAVILQRMVFGNAGGLSGSGVAFTRDPATGERRLYMDFLLDAQGEDIVSGRRVVDGAEELVLLAPELHERIAGTCSLLEREFGDAQEFEFTVQDGELFLLQTRTAKRTPWAALHIAVDLVREEVIPRETALERLAPVDIDGIRRVRVHGGDETAEVCRALPASMGVATGPIALDTEAATRLAHEGRPPVLVRPDTATEDIAGMAVAAGVLTGAGGRTSHAAVVARELDKPCLVGCADLEVDLGTRRAKIGRWEFSEGEEVCLDAESGRVFAGSPTLEEERPTEELAALASWADQRGETPQPTAQAAEAREKVLRWTRSSDEPTVSEADRS